jgi:hypothetical protein
MNSAIAKSLTMLLTFTAFSTAAEAGSVRDHRTNTGGSYNTSTTPPPSVNRPNKAVTNTNNGGVTVTSKPRKTNTQVCLSGIVPCTSNDTTVKIIKRARGLE